MRTSTRWMGWVICLLAIHHVAMAHEIRPAYLEIKETSTHQYDVIWKVPLLNQRIPDLTPTLSGGKLTMLQERQIVQAFQRHYQLETADGIGGLTLRIERLEETLIDALVNIQLLSGEQYSLLIQPSRPSVVIPVSTSRWQTAMTFGVLGIEHILFGWDHLLFVLGLFLIIKSRTLLLMTITGFTIAHSITLVLSSLGHVTLPTAPVETVIALSVVFLAREYLCALKGETSMTLRYPWIVAFTFGLLHGFGFAGALSSIGLPQHALTSALVAFNLGVELGQVLFIGLLLVITWSLSQLKWRRTPWISAGPGYAIGSLASFWFITRLLDIVA